MTVLLSIFLGLLPGLVWLGFFLKEDERPEPKKSIFFVFFTGAIAAFIAALLQNSIKDYFVGNGIFQQSILYVLVFVAIEEIFKFIFVYLTVFKSRFFDEPVDAMIYMVTGALGLATVENVALAIKMGAPASFDLMIFRFLGATLLHALSSAIVGYYWGRGIVKNRKFFYIIFGLAAAILLHFVFNYLIIFLKANGLVYSISVLVLTSFFVFYDFEKLKKNDTIKV